MIISSLLDVAFELGLTMERQPSGIDIQSFRLIISGYTTVSTDYLLNIWRIIPGKTE